MNSTSFRNNIQKLKYKVRARTRIRKLFSKFKIIYFKFNKIIFQRKVFEDILILQTYFPQENPHGHDNAEINSLLQKIKSIVAYRPFPISRQENKFELWKVCVSAFGSSESKFLYDKKGYLEYYKKSINSSFKDKIKYLYPSIKLRANLAYTNYLGQTFVLAPYLKENRIPFIFTLYPGGSFGLNNYISNFMLRDIFSNEYFKKVIVTNDVSLNYLLENNFCPKEKIELIFGGPIQFNKSQLNPSKKKFFSKDKDTFDICFVAFNYGDNGISKGYDLFVESAKKIVKSSNQINNKIRFHVVGNYDDSVFDITDIKEKIIFYGIRDSIWLLNFYYLMDIVICPNRPNVHYLGSFDGYPMGPEQSLCGVAMFQADKLNINQDFKYYKKDEIVHIELDSNDIASKIQYYFNNLEELYKLAENGRKKTEKLFDFERRTNKIKEILILNAKN